MRLFGSSSVAAASAAAVDVVLPLLLMSLLSPLALNHDSSFSCAMSDTSNWLLQTNIASPSPAWSYKGQAAKQHKLRTAVRESRAQRTPLCHVDAFAGSRAPPPAPLGLGKMHDL
ncbi:hypothetical protein N9L68_04855 [bacterium]|nr:hypothetical protein [bacterium]